MSFQEKLALVIPTLREVQSLPLLLDELRSLLAELGVAYEVLVVDDESRDGTEELVAAIAAEDPRIRLLVRRGERGLAGAILFGWQHTDASLLAVIDADLQHPPGALRDLLTAIGRGSDLALASRYAGGQALQCGPSIRLWISKISIWLTLPLQRQQIRVQDPMSGYFIVRRRCVENILFRASGFKLLLEILIRGRIRSIAEVPFAFGRRRAGKSKAGLKVAWDYLLLLARLYALRMKEACMPEQNREARLPEEEAAREESPQRRERIPAPF